MLYRRKVAILAGLNILMALVYTGSLVFSPERTSARNAAYRWLDPSLTGQADRITLRGSSGEIGLFLQDGAWFTQTGGIDYPVKQSRVEDLLGLLSAQGNYPARGSATSHERLGLTGEAAPGRITVEAGGGSQRTLLDLLVGVKDAAGREVYLRKSQEDGVRSGEDVFSAYLDGEAKTWYNLRLFPDAPALDLVQRVTAAAPPPEAGEDGLVPPAPPPLVISRREGGWTIEGLPDESLDNAKVEPYIRSILEAEGDTFIPDMSAEDPVYNEGRISLELGDGTSRRISLGPVREEGGVSGRSAAVSGSQYVYSLTQWTVNRLFKDASYFTRQN